jgi:hypothetical protein
MNTNEYIEKLNSNIQKIMDEETYVNVLRLDNNLSRFNVLNRIAFAVTNDKEIYDVKTKEEWFALGRQVINQSDKIYTLLPKYRTFYRDTKTDNEIDINEFTSDELQKALELKVVYKVEEAEDFLLYTLYDIRNTSSINSEQKYSIPKPIINLNIYFSIISKLTGIEVVESEDMNFFDDKNKTLYLMRDTYENTVDILTDSLLKYILKEDNYREFIKESAEIFDNIKQQKNKLNLLRESVKFSIQTLFGKVNKNNVIIALRQSGIKSYEELVEILMIADEIVLNIVQYIEYTGDSIYVDAITNITRIKKSEILLNIMQANSIHKKMEGN